MGYWTLRSFWLCRLPQSKDRLVIYGVAASNTPVFCLSTRVEWEQLQTQRLSECCSGDGGSSSSSRQLVAAKPLGAVHGSEENKSIKAGALLLAPLVRGGAEQRRGRHHVYLIQLGSLWGLPWERPAKKGAAGPSNKDVQPTPLPRMNPPH